MAQYDLHAFIFKRRSIRKYLPEPIGEQAFSDLRSFMAEIRPLFPGIRTEIKIYDAKEIKGLLRTDAKNYIAFFSEPKEGHLANAGFMLQQIDLFLSANGLGNCYQGMAKITKGVDAPPGLELVILTSFGRPAEELHRSSVAEFKRKPIEKISSVIGMDDIMETARLAPSGVNNQSWYFTGGDGVIQAYAERSLISYRMNQINVGIALCHIWLTVEHAGRTVEFTNDKERSSNVQKGYSYTATVTVK